MRVPKIFLIGLAAVSAAAQSSADSFADGQAFLRTYCVACHQGDSPAAGFDVRKLNTSASFSSEANRWTAVISRVKNGEMPPAGAPKPEREVRDKFTQWAETASRPQACASGMAPARMPIRRLNREEYNATIQYLLDIHMDVGQALPADGAGGEGFDNAAEALVLSPLHAEKYLEAARLAMDFASKEFKSRRLILVAKPGPGVSDAQAAHDVLKAFLPRAFRRPVTESEIVPYVTLFRAAEKQGRPFESAVFFTLQGVLMSPHFLFHDEPENDFAEVRTLNQYALASRLSYFLWGTMPEPLLFDLAAQGKLNQPEVLKTLVHRMVQDERSVTFADRFVSQWLRTRELGANKIPDPKMFPEYSNEELRSDIRYQPILFFRELLAQNLSLLNLVDSHFTIFSNSLAKLYGEKPADKKTDQQPEWLELPPGSQRGGLLGMAAVLAVSSYPHRTSPVLRGAWILESMLGTPPPAPPPNVPALPEDHSGDQPTSVRERLTLHRANPACAGCHSRIDPLGFALEHYDALGKWRDTDGGKPVDSTGELADGTKINGLAELKTYLLARKDLLIHNLAGKMLGYALGRALTPADACVVDDIAAQVKYHDYSAQTLLEATVLSTPFRFQAPHVAPARGPAEERSQ